jgi:hypothetical protein
MKRQGALRLDAELMVDTLSGPRRAGLRASDTGRRQLLYRAGDLYLDLSIHRREGSPERALIGQIVDGGTASRNLADLSVELDFANGEKAQTRSNGLGEFLLAHVPEGVATLAVAIDRWTDLQVPLPAAFGAGRGDR